MHARPGVTISHSPLHRAGVDLLPSDGGSTRVVQRFGFGILCIFFLMVSWLHGGVKISVRYIYIIFASCLCCINYYHYSKGILMVWF